MKFLSFLMALALVLSGCFLSQNEKSSKNSESDSNSGTMILRFAEQSHKTHPAALASEYFSNLVEQKTDGKIRVKVYYDAELGDGEEVLEQLKFGGIALGRVSFSALNEAVPSLSSFSEKIISNPLLCRAEIIGNRDFVAEKCLSEKLCPLAVFYSDKRCFYADSRKFYFSSMRFFKDVKIGTEPSKLIQNELKKYGAIPVEIGESGTYQSMQKGFLNLCESEVADFILGDDYSFAAYIMISDYISNPSLLVISNEIWHQLSVEQRKIFFDCAEEAAEYQKNMMERFYTANLKTVQDNKKVLYLRKY